MKRLCVFLVLLALTAAFGFAQTREESRIYIRSVAENPAHADFFLENFTITAITQGYTLAENAADADLTLVLRVVPNVILYDDGTEEPAPPGEKQFLLRLNLTRNFDNVEIIAFSFPFTELEEMYYHNPYLFEVVMESVPFVQPDFDPTVIVEVVREVSNEVIREVEVEVVREVQVVREVHVIREVVRVEPDLWRNKWFYLRLSADFPLTYYRLRPTGLLDGSYIFSGNGHHSYIGSQHVMVPGATVGFELQFLNWMSAALNFEMRFADAIDYAFVPGIGLQLKFPIKPLRHFMLEPYIAASYTFNTAAHSDSSPGLALGGGFQFAVKGGESGAWFFDVNFMYTLNEVRTRNIFDSHFPNPAILHWNRFVVGLGIGYKFGFIDR